MEALRHADIKIIRDDTDKYSTSRIHTCNAPHAQSQSLHSKSTDSSKNMTPTTSSQTKTGPYVTRYG